jgi:hypothetical protein
MSDGRPVEVHPVVLMYAFRYALGRMTYAVGDMADILIANRESLRIDWRAQVARDITEAIDNDAAGMSCDREQWGRVRAALMPTPEQLTTAKVPPSDWPFPHPEETQR